MTTKQFVRYDLYKDGELHNGGMLSNCSETNVYNIATTEGLAYGIMRRLCNELTIPPYYKFREASGGNDRAFFTPEGYEHFAEAVEQLAELINEADGGWKAVKRTIDVEALESNHTVYYRDEHQVVVSKEPTKEEPKLHGFTSYKGRQVKHGQEVKVYKNLHKNTYSIADAKTGLVLGYADNVTLKNAKFKVSEAGRQRVLCERKKNVHAFVIGAFYGTTGAPQNWIAYYNPYKTRTFETSAGVPIQAAAVVTLDSKGVTYMGRD